ncbi:MAG: alpha/beta hydrolase [Clostridia bacterium]|jgi:alpha-beta hydrolase superfamily lysophospholipase|nr:alpha/beta hydrolase [Clostridia bacterium]
MREENLIINSESDNLQISVTIFIPETEVKGIVQISHGMAEHKERYYDFMRFLTNNGYVTIINDHRGHGKSVKSNEDLGYFYDNKAEYIVEDLHQITLYIKEKYPNKKIVLFGHSMGSMVVRKYLKKYDKDIDKLIVCGSPSKNSFSKLGVIVSKIMKCLKGEKYRSKFIHKLAFGNYNKKLKKVKSNNSWVCANEESVTKYDNDKLCGFVFTTNGFENLFKLMGDIYTFKGWKLYNKKMPIFFIAGSDDPVIINKQKWLKSQEFLKKIGYLNITNRLYNNLRHEILNEKNRDEVYNDVLDFINM